MSEHSTSGPRVERSRAQPRTKRRATKLPPYNVVLFDDNDHSYEYAVQMLRALFGYDEQIGTKLATEVGMRGRAVVMTTHRELAELKRDQIHSYGADEYVATSKGSMAAIIEPAG